MELHMNIKRKILYISVFILIVCGSFIFYKGDSFIKKQKEISPKYKAGEELSFFITTDIHYLANSLNDHGEAFKMFVDMGDGKQQDYIDELTEAFINDIEKKKPQVLIISGDLTNNGEKESHLELSKKLKRIEALGTEVYVIPGNHDIMNPHARRFEGSEQYKVDSISDKDFSRIYGDFGYKEAISRDKTTLSYLAAPSEDTWFLMVDTNQYMNNKKNNAPQTDGVINTETFQWIKQCVDLAKEKNAKVIPVMHHNIMNHSEIIRKGYTLNNSQEALNLFQSYGLDLVFSGHIHVQDISSYKNGEKPIYEIVNSSFAVYPQQYGVFKYSPGKGYDYSTSIVDVEGWSKEKGITDENLNNFRDYAKTHFGNKAFDKALWNLVGSKDFTTEEVEKMCETISILNLNYFAGTQNQITEEVLNSEGYKLWQRDAGSFYKRYINSMIRDNDMEDTRFHID